MWLRAILAGTRTLFQFPHASGPTEPRRTTPAPKQCMFECKQVQDWGLHEAVLFM